jgi:hypothetical protein
VAVAKLGMLCTGGEKIRHAGIGEDGGRVGKQDAFQAGSKNKICVKLISLFCYT